ncbi:MAG: DUF4340 domain-containing protein, partial [Verrucomicrobiales bacterium]
MRVSTTIALAVISIILGILISGLNRSPDFDDAAATNVLARFAPEEVDKIVIEKGPAKVTLLKKGEWFFAEPEQDRADSQLIEKLLDELNHLSIIDEFGAGEQELTSTQLGVEGDQAIRIQLSGKPEDGDEIGSSLVLGAEAPRQNAIYAKRSDGIYVVDGNPRQWVEEPLAMLRDRRLISAPVEAIVQLGITRSTGKLAL